MLKTNRKKVCIQSAVLSPDQHIPWAVNFQYSIFNELRKWHGIHRTTGEQRPMKTNTKVWLPPLLKGKTFSLSWLIWNTLLCSSAIFDCKALVHRLCDWTERARRRNLSNGDGLDCSVSVDISVPLLRFVNVKWQLEFSKKICTKQQWAAHYVITQ